MKWNKETQIIFECADKGLSGLRKLGWLTQQEYDDIQKILDKSIEKEQKTR
jgi:hypothetical protein